MARTLERKQHAQYLLKLRAERAEATRLAERQKLLGEGKISAPDRWKPGVDKPIRRIRQGLKLRYFGSEAAMLDLPAARDKFMGPIQPTGVKSTKRRYS